MLELKVFVAEVTFVFYRTVERLWTAPLRFSQKLNYQSREFQTKLFCYYLNIHSFISTEEGAVLRKRFIRF